jgi:hypothetical protein
LHKKLNIKPNFWFKQKNYVTQSRIKTLEEAGSKFGQKSFVEANDANSNLSLIKRN